MRFILLSLVVNCLASPALGASGVLGASPAPAANYDAAPIVSAHRSGNGGEAAASVDIHASPARVWSVLSDCAHARRFMRDLISCRVLERGRGWQVREHRIRGWLLKPVIRNVLRVSLTPNRRLAFRRISGDWARSQGAWTLSPIENGRGTHVSYHIEAAINGPIPVPQSRLIAGVRATLSDLRAVSEASAST